MQDEIGNLVHPVIAYGLALKERLDRGGSPSLHAEQATLRSLLLTEPEAARWADFGGEPEGRAAGFKVQPVESEAPAGGERFLGARYALVCWLDELFILNTSWEAAWNERKLEVTLYGTNDRAWRFWEQAKRAEARPTTDALETFFFCVMLGFRGELREQPEKLQAWVTAARARLGRLGQPWAHPPELDPPTNVPPLRGRERFRRMMILGSLVVLLLVPVVTFLLVQHLSE